MSQSAQVAFVREVKRLGDEALADLRAIDDVPSEDRRDWDEFLARSEEQIAVLAELEDAVRAADREEAARVSAELQQADARANEAARDYGLEECGR